jgi:hypothetical protein
MIQIKKMKNKELDKFNKKSIKNAHDWRYN